MGLWPTQGDEKRLGPATTFDGTVALSFVIPSEAEGPAVPRTLRGNVFRQSVAQRRDLRFSFRIRDKEAHCLPPSSSFAASTTCCGVMVNRPASGSA
jgi:hypothetical protein